MDKLFEVHFNRVFTSVLKKETAASIAQWIPKETTHAMQPFTYYQHEYQERILSDTSQHMVVQKCSQVGISEVSVRKALALVNVLSPYTVCYTLPTAKFGGTFMRTRIDPVIQGSKTMLGNIHSSTDNSEVKRFGDSYLWLKGAASSNAPISIPVDHLIHDEVDFSDQEVLGQYTSRLTHSPWTKVDKFSTPTLPGFGINKAFKESRRHYLMCKCNHCNFQFVPSYYDHVRIPKFWGDLREMNKAALTKLHWEQAHLECPECGKVPSLMPEHREWVCENPDENHLAAGYQVSPFDAPMIISCADLVKASTSYARIQDFVNFNLGLAAEDAEATLTAADFTGIIVQAEVLSAAAYVMGVDVGNVYHFVVAAIDTLGDMVVVHREQVPMGKARERYAELRLHYRIICTVIDSAPHAETVMALQATDVNLFAAVYNTSKSIVTHNVKDRDEKKDEGKSFVRQVDINRSRAFDGYMEYIRTNHMQIVASDDDQTYIEHHTSMKRVKTYDPESGEMVYTWQKTDGNDHYHHAALYCWIAGRIRGVGRTTVIIPTTMIFKFRLQQK